MKSQEDIQDLLKSVGEPGNISKEAIAYALYVKQIARQKKGKEFNAYAMDNSEIKAFNNIIQDMIKHCTVDLRFQIAFCHLNTILSHWSFLEFNFTARNGSPSLDILICDPLGTDKSLVLLNLLSSVMEFGALSKWCDLTIYIPTDILQEAGRTCAYFVLDTIVMLSNQNDFAPTYEYMASHQNLELTEQKIHLLANFRESVAVCYDKEQLDDIYNFKMVLSPLPGRLLRTKQDVALLLKQIKNSGEQEDIVSHKGINLRQSINQFLFFVEDRHGEQCLRNIRVNSKMKQWADKVSAFSTETEIEIKGDSFDNAIKEHGLYGLVDLVKSASDFPSGSVLK